MNLAEARQKTAEALELLTKIEKDFGSHAVDRLVAKVKFIEENYANVELPADDLWYVYAGSVVQVNGDLVVIGSQEFQWDGIRWVDANDVLDEE